MRTRGDERDAVSRLPPSPSGEGLGDAPERRCILSGAHGPRAALIRLALGPDGVVAPDVRARAPGRGAWIGVDRATLAAALGKGKLRAALQRAFRTSALSVPADLPEQIERALARAALDRLGLENRAGGIVTGSDRIAEALRRGGAALLVHAADAAPDGTRKLEQALRAGHGGAAAARGVVIPAGRAILSLALGRENVVHLAVIASAAADRVGDAIARWQHFIGRDEIVIDRIVIDEIVIDRDVEPCDPPSQAPSAPVRQAESPADP